MTDILSKAGGSDVSNSFSWVAIIACMKYWPSEMMILLDGREIQPLRFHVHERYATVSNNKSKKKGTRLDRRVFSWENENKICQGGLTDISALGSWPSVLVWHWVLVRRVRDSVLDSLLCLVLSFVCFVRRRSVSSSEHQKVGLGLTGLLLLWVVHLSRKGRRCHVRSSVDAH